MRRLRCYTLTSGDLIHKMNHTEQKPLEIFQETYTYDFSFQFFSYISSLELVSLWLATILFKDVNLCFKFNVIGRVDNSKVWCI